jgi:hypothetical protein
VTAEPLPAETAEARAAVALAPDMTGQGPILAYRPDADLGRDKA